MSQPETRTLPGRWVTAVLAGVVVLLGLTAVAFWVLTDDSASDLVDPPEPPAAPIAPEQARVDIDDCRRLETPSAPSTDRFGDPLEVGAQGGLPSAEASGTVTNTGDAATGYDLVILLEDADGRRLDVMTTLVPQVGPGESAAWTVRSYRLLPEGPVRCALASVGSPRSAEGDTVPGT